MEEKVDTEKSNKEAVRRQEVQTKYIMIIMALLIIGIFASMWVVSESKKFDYVGLKWIEENFGEIPVFSTSITGYGVNNAPIDFKMSFRNDPRKLEKIPVEGNVKLVQNLPMYFSMDLDSNITQCGTLSLVNFGRFMAEMRYNIITSVPTQKMANKFDRPLANCENRQNNTVFLLTSGNESKIIQNSKNPNCYILQVNKCQDVEVVEKMQVEVLSSLTGIKS